MHYGALPSFFFVSGFGSTVGGAAHASNLGGNGEEISLAGGALGRFVYFGEASFHADRTLGSSLWLDSRARIDRRGEEIFQGIGDRSGPESRYREERLVVAERGGLTFGRDRRVTRIGGGFILERSTFGATAYSASV